MCDPPWVAASRGADQGWRRPAPWPVPRLLRYDGPGLVRRLGEHPMADAFVASHHGPPGEPGDDGNPLHDCSLSISDGGGPAGCKPPIAVPGDGNPTPQTPLYR